jgi:hypothetical protein
MRLIFVSGPYRASGEWEVAENIRHAELASLRLWKEGWAVFCPHKNTAFFGGACDDHVWLEGDLEILRRCDAIYMLNSWEKSSGAAAELEEAKRMGLVVFFEPKENGKLAGAR